MANYSITYLDETEPREDASQGVRFRVESEDDRFTVVVDASDTVDVAGPLADVDLMALLRLAGLREVETRLKAGFFPHDWASRGVTTTLTFGGGDLPELLRLWRSDKECLWRQAAEPRGHICQATHHQESFKTSLALCDVCGIPDASLICDALVFPAISADGGLGAGGRRDPVSADCELGNTPGERGKACRPGEMECWHRVIETGPHVPDPDVDAPRRVIDEIGYLRLVYADRFELARGRTKAFWPKSDESAVNSLRNPCSGLPEFRAHVLALCQMLLAMKPHGQLSVDRQKGTDGHAVNGITALGRVLDDRFAGAGLTGMASLEALNAARNLFSHEDRKGLVAAMRTLGVMSYPPTGSCEVAWWQVAASVAEGLAQIRMAIQNTIPSQLTEQ